MPTPPELVMRGTGGRGLHQGVQLLITRWNVGDIVSTNAPVYVSTPYWNEQLSMLPNPPYPYDGKHLNPADVPGRALWWDGRLDIVLIEFPALAGTGHGGKFDADDDNPYYDRARADMDYGKGKGGLINDGCVFVPTSALDFKKMKLVENENVHISAQYLSDRQWPTAPMIANLAQYGIQARVMGEMLGVSRQAIHKQIAKMPDTIRAMTAVYGVGYTTPPCKVCGQPARLPHSKYCQAHYELVCEEQGKYGALGAQAIAGKPRRGRVSRAFNYEAKGSINDWLPLVDQSADTTGTTDGG